MVLEEPDLVEEEEDSAVGWVGQFDGFTCVAGGGLSRTYTCSRRRPCRLP